MGTPSADPVETQRAPVGRIVPLGREHLPGFHAALDRIAREGRYLALLQAPSLARTRKFVLDSLKSGAIHLVVLDGSDVIGWCDVRPKSAATQRHSAVLGMGLLNEYRGLGIGSRLLAAALELAHERGLRRIELVVRADNEVALRLYRRYGFQPEGTLHRYLNVDGVDHDALVMARLE
jgi:ribosomal protein S18 acetylase RimI-like enzyme